MLGKQRNRAGTVVVHRLLSARLGGPLEHRERLTIMGSLKPREGKNILDSSGLVSQPSYDDRDSKKPSRLVRIAYFDHAGLASEDQEPIAVAAAILIHGDDQWRDIEKSRDQILADPQWGLTETQQAEFEFHATKLFSSGHEPFEKWPKQKRWDLLSGYCF